MARGGACAPFLVPLQDVIFFHDQFGNPWDIQIPRENADNAFRRDRSVHYWMWNNQPVLCRKRPGNMNSFAV
jgi:hypothetical protein